MSMKTYWKGIEQLTNDPDFVKNAEKEFPQHLPIKDAYGDNTVAGGNNRRDFLKMMGFSMAAVSLAACEAPVRKAIPYLNKPEDIDPGIPNYYASTYIDGSDYCPVLVKTREGRPVFVEGNSFSSLTKGGTSPRANASVVSLYDIEKAKGPSKNGQDADWAAIDAEISQALSSAANIRIVCNSIISPSTKRAMALFAQRYASAKTVMYDQESAHGLLSANKAMFGKAVVPSYHFEKADVVVSVGADFLGSWISGVEFSAHFSETRKVGKDKKNMSRHYQFEPIMSLSGANADYRTPVKVSQEGLVVAKLYNLVAASTGGQTHTSPDIDVARLDQAVTDLLAAKGKSIVVSGSNDVNIQLLVNGINQMLGNYGATIDMETPSFQKQGSDQDMEAFVADLTNGRIDAVLFYNCNPVYDHPKGEAIAAAIKNLKVSVATADKLNETSSLCTYNCPDSHYLESWNDAEPKKGYFSLGQPTISTIFNTRQAQDSFLKWAGAGVSYQDMVQEYWKTVLFPMQSEEETFETFWYRSLHNGVFEPGKASPDYVSVHEKASEAETAAPDMGAAFRAIGTTYKADNNNLELVVYSSLTMGPGTQANNPILQETPEPISKTTWGNFVAVTQKQAKELGMKRWENRVDVAKLTVNGVDYELPVVIQPGQAENTVSVMLGYGRDPEKAGKVAAEAGGANAFKMLKTSSNGELAYAQTEGVSIVLAGKRAPLAITQTHETFLGRETIIQETTLPEYQKDPKAGRFEPKITTYSGKEDPGNITLWDISGDGYRERRNVTDNSLWNDRLGQTADIHEYTNHHWGLTIDLNSCTGCSACVVACHVENNVPVVGKAEVVMRREMHWLRIDRYYSTKKDASSYEELEVAVENPEVVFQPMMCQHCNNAPCETVCPVAATTHSSEGLNQMTYNRCIGTKYCANNCPYKVRRFNWFKYHDNKEFDYNYNNDLGKMVINPDVTVRSRGVMEKCSLCVQRIQAGKLTAKREKRRTKDGDITTACASACPTNAITFGDLNDKGSEIRQTMEHELDSRAYTVLEEVNTKPNVWYFVKVRNNSEGNA